MSYPTIEQQHEKLQQDKAYFYHLKATNPEAAKNLACHRLRNAGILDDNDEYTEEFLVAWNATR